MDDALRTPWQNFVDVISHPYRLFQAIIEYMLAWTYTRRWIVLLRFSPALIVMLGCLGLVAYGWTISNAKLAERYSVWVEQQIAAEIPSAGSSATGLDESEGDTTAAPATSAADGAAEVDPDFSPESASSEQVIASEHQIMKTEQVSPFTEMLLRRLMILDHSNLRATYLVGMQLAIRNKLGQARQLMRRVAPEDDRGFAPAHTWLAADRLFRLGVDLPESRDQALHDLEIAATWSGTGPVLLAAYADLLESVGRASEAIAVLNTAVQQAPELQIKMANMAYRHKQQRPLQQASSQAKQRIQARVESGEATGSDFASLANLALLDNKPDEAIAFAERGLKSESDEAAQRSLKRLRSEALRLKYLLSVRLSIEGTQVDLNLLDAALRADPTNPLVSEEVAKLLALGVQSNEGQYAALQEQLLNGQATALTHVLVAVRKLKDGALQAAIPHLELALRQAPNSPVIQNNLALALAKTQPDKLERSLQLIDAAVATNPANPETLDSQGQIRLLAGDEAGAIESLEQAIKYDPSRDKTRKMLADAYEQFGLPEMAEAQRALIRKATVSASKHDAPQEAKE